MSSGPVFGAVAAALTLAVVPVGPARSARPEAQAPPGPTQTHCTFTSTIALAPGLSVVPSSGTFTSGGETGTVSCDGPVRGIVPTGPGTLGVEGRYGTRDPDTCFGGEGEGRFSF